MTITRSKVAMLGIAIASPLLAHSQPAPPDAAKPSFTVFGAANAQFERVSATGGAVAAADKPARQRVSNVSSDLGFRGQMPLGNGLSAQFQYVTGINLDSAATAAGLFGSAKDAFVGLGIANVGVIKFGRLSGAARWNSGTPDFSPAGAGPQDNQAMLSLVSGQTGAAPAFNARIDNAIGFESAAWNGLSVRAYYGANEGRSQAVPSTGAPLSDHTYSLGVRYVLGDLDVRLSFEQREDKGTLNGSTANKTRDKDYRLGVRYRLFSNTQLAMAADHMSFSDATATGSAKRGLWRRGWVFGARHQMGDHVVYGGFGTAGNVRCSLANGGVCNGEETGARQWVLAYNYLFNRQLLAEAFVSRVNNERRARYDFDAGGVAPAVGANPSAIGAGLRYVF